MMHVGRHTAPTVPGSFRNASCNLSSLMSAMYYMQDHNAIAPVLTARDFLELTRELSIGQRSADSVERLASFLHAKIFPRFHPFSAEIYLGTSQTVFAPPPFVIPTSNWPDHTPGPIKGEEEMIGCLQSTKGLVAVNGDKASPLLSATGNRSHLLVPLRDAAELIGFLYIGSRATLDFPLSFQEGVETLAAVIGSRLKSMSVIRKLQESKIALEYSEQLRTALHEISEQAHFSANISELYTMLHGTVRQLIHAPNFFIAIVEKDNSGNYLSFPYFVDEYDSFLQGTHHQLSAEVSSLTEYLLQNRQPLLLGPNDFDGFCRAHRINFMGTKPHSWLGVPFYLNHLSGAVVVQSYDQVIYTEKDKELMAFVARHIGDALSHKRSVDELKDAKERAEQAEKNKSAFLANMSHEIRTPMNGIIGMTELVLASDISPQQRSYLDMVHSSADRLLKLINDILDFSKIEAGKLELHIAPFSLRNVIANSLQILAISAAEKNIDLDVHCDGNIPDNLVGDADKFSQILINLAGNALKFTKKGSVTLSVFQDRTKSISGENAFLRFQIKDTGIGIPPDKLASVFNAFSQIGTTRDSSHRGTGLGLVIAAELIEMMGGSIFVESQPGVGTSFHFTVRFPLSQPESASLARGDDRDIPFLTPLAALPRRILLVEDEYINQTLALAVLEREGWQVTTAENGRVAIDLLARVTFDLVLMDIQMPELDGFATTKLIREAEAASGRHQPIIAMTAYAIKGDKEKCLAAGMDGYISKPIRPSLLRTEIETILRA